MRSILNCRSVLFLLTSLSLFLLACLYGSIVTISPRNSIPFKSRYFFVEKDKKGDGGVGTFDVFLGAPLISDRNS